MTFNPLKGFLVLHGLHPIYFTQYRHGWHAAHDSYEQMTREVYSRPMVEHSTAFWVSLRKMFPGATSPLGMWIWQCIAAGCANVGSMPLRHCICTDACSVLRTVCTNVLLPLQWAVVQMPRQIHASGTVQ